MGALLLHAKPMAYRYLMCPDALTLLSVPTIRVGRLKPSLMAPT